MHPGQRERKRKERYCCIFEIFEIEECMQALSIEDPWLGEAEQGTFCSEAPESGPHY